MSVTTHTSRKKSAKGRGKRGWRQTNKQGTKARGHRPPRQPHSDNTPASRLQRRPSFPKSALDFKSPALHRLASVYHRHFLARLYFGAERREEVPWTVLSVVVAV
jgi:hypothetical protein